MTGARMKLLISVFLFCFSFGCLANGFDIEQKCNNGLTVSAKLENSISTFSFWDNYSFSNDMPLLWGEVNITNSTSIDKKFSTKQLMLSIDNELSVRGYSNTIASVAIDIGFIIIKPQQSIEVKVYWPSEKSIGQRVDKLELNCAVAP